MKRDNIIEEIRKKDLPDLQEMFKNYLEKNVSYEKMYELYMKAKDDQNIYILGYYIKDILVGTFTLNILTLLAGEQATIWNLAVKDEYRNLGIATKLMTKAEEIAAINPDIKRILLFSGSHRKEAHALYRKLGYDENRDKGFIKQLT